MSKIVDNVGLKLADQLKQVLPHSKHLDACVGYFNLRGWEQIRTSTSHLEPRDDGDSPIRLLVGMALSEDSELRNALLVRHGIGSAKMDLGRAMKLAEQALVSFVDQLAWGTPSKRDALALRALRSDLSEGRITVKFAARHPLHAKLYVCHLQGGLAGYRATVGSSNLTYAGLSGQGELNLEESDQETTKDLAKWFQDRWQDPFSIDITEDLVRVLDESWAQVPQPSPYLVHLRLAHELSRDAREGLLLDIPEAIRKDLLPHQESAVRVATQMLGRKGLAVIGDVVGLGKTRTGTAIAATVGETVLVICPKNLVKMWKSVLDHYSVPSNVVSLSMVASELPTLRRYRLVLIDEAHNLRHNTRQDWKAIRTYIELNDPMVILMTATMFNASHLDISGQLGLKLDPDEDLGMRPERLLEDINELELGAKVGGKLTTLEAFQRSEYVEDWQRLLSQFLVRRTRKFLEANYGTLDPETGRVYFTFPNGTRFQFPKRKAEPLPYVGGPDDAGERLASEDNFKAIGKMKFARYSMGNYLIDGVIGTNEAEKAYIEDLRKSKTTAAGFIRTTALKRLASSGHAFLTTIDRMLLRNRMLEHALVEGLLLPVGTYSELGITAEDIDIDDEVFEDSEVSGEPVSGFRYGAISTLDSARKSYDLLSAKSPRGLKWMSPTLFNSETLLRDLRKDSEFLAGLLSEFGNWDPNEDSKLNALETLISTAQTKVLIFSEYADTVDYLSVNLRKRLPDLEIADASSRSADPTEIARRFSPVSNEEIGGLPEGKTEIDVLVTTDVLSEGQNLQDCAVVVNWDMPWTIIKIIQRAGRVDRVGQKADVIRVLTFLAQDSVEGKIRNVHRLKQRLKTAKEILGHDEDFFDDVVESEDLIDGLFNGEADLIGDEGDVDFASFALGIWNAARVEDQRAATALGLGSHSTIAKVDLSDIIVYCQTESGYDVLSKIPIGEPSSKVATTVSPMEALKRTSCEAGDTPGDEVSNHHALVEVAFTEHVVKQLDKALVLAHSGLRKRLYEFLSLVRDQNRGTVFESPEVDKLQDTLLKSPIRKSIEKTVVELLRHAQRTGDSQHVVERLLELDNHGSLLDRVADSGSIPKLVVSMAVGHGE